MNNNINNLKLKTYVIKLFINRVQLELIFQQILNIIRMRNLYKIADTMILTPP